MTKRDDIEFAKNTIAFEKFFTAENDLSDEQVSSYYDKIKEFAENVINAPVSKEKKYKALDDAVFFTSKYSLSNTLYCNLLLQQTTLASATKQQDDLKRMVMQTIFHRYNVDPILLGEIFTALHKKIKGGIETPKFNAYNNIISPAIKAYKKHYQEKSRRSTEEKIAIIDQYLENPNIDADKKFQLIDELLEIITQKDFGRINANKMKVSYCQKAIKLCTEHWPNYNDLKERYTMEARHFQKIADQARLHSGLMTPEEYMRKYRNDRDR